MKRFQVVFENAPQDGGPWITGACKAAGLYLVDNDKIAEAMSKDEAARKAILESQQAPWGINEKLIPFYRKALEEVAGRQAQLGLISSNWLAYAEKPDLCIIDFDPLEAHGRDLAKGGMPPKDAAQYVKTYTGELAERARKYLSPDRILLLPKGAPDSQKAELTAAFIRKLVR